MPYFGPKYLGWRPSNNIISKKLLFDFSTDSRVLDYEFEALVHPIFDVKISQGFEVTDFERVKVKVTVKTTTLVIYSYNKIFLVI